MRSDPPETPREIAAGLVGAVVLLVVWGWFAFRLGGIL